MKLSDMTMAHLAMWCHVAEDYPLLPDAWEAAKAAVYAHTGLTEGEADRHPDLTMAAVILANDMIYNRALHVGSDKVSAVFERFISLHDMNLLPKGDAGNDA